MHRLLTLISEYQGTQLQGRIQSSVKGLTTHLLGSQRYGPSIVHECTPCTHSNTCINKCKNVRQCYRSVRVAGHTHTDSRTISLYWAFLLLAVQVHFTTSSAPHHSFGNLLSLLHVLIVPHTELYATLCVNSNNNSLQELLLSPPLHPVPSKRQRSWRRLLLAPLPSSTGVHGSK